MLLQELMEATAWFSSSSVTGPLLLNSFILVAEGVFRSRLTSVKVRSLLTAAIYRKIGEFPYWFHQTWTTNFQLCFSLVLLYHVDAPELHNENVINKCCNDNMRGSISIKYADFSWEDNLSKPTLRKINLEVRLGQNVAICGEVGSGKSTILAAILKEVPCTQGTIDVYGKFAYVSQTTWIQTGEPEWRLLEDTRLLLLLVIAMAATMPVHLDHQSASLVVANQPRDGTMYLHPWLKPNHNLCVRVPPNIRNWHIESYGKSEEFHPPKFHLHCNPGQTIISIKFASFATPLGTCGNYEQGACHSTASYAILEKENHKYRIMPSSTVNKKRRCSSLIHVEGRPKDSPEAEKSDDVNILSKSQIDAELSKAKGMTAQEAAAAAAKSVAEAEVAIAQTEAATREAEVAQVFAKAVVMKNANESLVHELGLCANLSQMYISNQQENTSSNKYGFSGPMDSPRHRRQLINDYYDRGSQAPDPTAF
ncbi:P-loop containing nucleoside triphosphate hydrolase [Sesbania bispinosa]|nr:P-loop containing nucleoside triphosphate hydrolase [Sesbania bispinosa]